MKVVLTVLIVLLGVFSAQARVIPRDSILVYTEMVTTELATDADILLQLTQTSSLSATDVTAVYLISSYIGHIASSITNYRLHYNQIGSSCEPCKGIVYNLEQLGIITAVLTTISDAIEDRDIAVRCNLLCEHLNTVFENCYDSAADSDCKKQITESLKLTE